MFKKIINKLLISCLISSSLFGANIIFDLGGVLIKTDKMRAFSKLGIHIIPYRLKGGDVKKKLYEILDNIAGHTQSAAKDPDGDTLPILMCNWMANTKTAQEILGIIIEQTNKNPNWFANNTEKKLVQNLAKMMFTPQSFIQTQKVINKDLVKYCKQQGHKCYILSNWEKDSFELLCKKDKNFFDLFDGVVVSGDASCLKPDYYIYQKLLTDYNLNPDECVFIDDQKENIIAAKEMGIYGIHCKKSGNPNLQQIKTKLLKWEKKTEDSKKNSWFPQLTKTNMVKFLITVLVFSTLIKTVI